MTANLAGQKPKDTYQQLLNVDGGVTATLTTVSGGDGVASALKISSGAASVDNVKIDGNTISTTDTNGNLVLSPNGTGAVAVANVAITGGSVAGITDLAVADGGTGASTASDARTNLGLGTMATQADSSVAITGGSVKATTAIGYNTGGGGTVTQLTDKSTAVTLNAPSGQITTHNASLNSVTAVSFTLTNSSIAAADAVVLSIKSGATAGAYHISISAVAAGSCQITIYNRTGGALGEAIVLNFVVIKGATS